MNLLAWLRRRASTRRDRRPRPELEAFSAAVAQLRVGDVALDCGANVGKFTVMMARSGATVHAFEPNPDAFAELRRRTTEYPLVQLHPVAITATPGPVKLYLHKWAGADPVHWSTGSSLLPAKNNVRQDRFTLVEGISLAAFLRTLGAPRIQLLKMDIEGAEVAVLNELVDAGLNEVIERAFIETHDRRVRELVGPTRQLRARLRALGLDNFRLDWR